MEQLKETEHHIEVISEEILEKYCEKVDCFYAKLRGTIKC